MAYLLKRQTGKQRYYYIMESRRRGDKVTSVCLEYLGNVRDVSPARLKRALAYWRVGRIKRS